MFNPDEIQAWVADRFFTELNDRLAQNAEALADNIEKALTIALNTFFSTVANALKGESLTAPPSQIAAYLPAWKDLNPEYEVYQKHGQIDYFVFSELPRLKRRTARAREKTRKTMGLQYDRANSLRNQLGQIRDFSKVYGTIQVEITSMTKVNRGGRRQYRAGTQRNGANVGGKPIKFDADYVTIAINWVPKLAGMDVMRRGVTEGPLNPRVKRKLLNHDDAYRPLIGPFLLYYQDKTVNQIINANIKRFGGSP